MHVACLILGLHDDDDDDDDDMSSKSNDMMPCMVLILWFWFVNLMDTKISCMHEEIEKNMCLEKLRFF